MTSFKEFFALQEVIDTTAAQDVVWQKQPQVGGNAKAIFRAGNFAYWISFSANNASNLFTDKRQAYAYSISFDAVRNSNGQPITFHQAVAQQQQLQARSNAAPPSKKGFGGVVDTPNADIPYVTPGNFSRTGVGASQVLGSVVGVINQFEQAVRPEIIQWIPADMKLQRMYKMLITKFSQGRYTLVADQTMLVRNDLVPYIEPKWLEKDDIWDDAEAYRMF